MDPSPEVVSMFVDVSSMAARCDMDAITTVSLLSHLGIRPEMHPRVLAALPQEALATRISSWRQDDDAALSPARILCGVVRRQSEIDAIAASAEAEAWRQHELERKSETDASQSQAKKVKIATMADQSNDQEVAESTQEQILEAYVMFAKKLVGPPAPQEKLTAEQLTALYTIFRGSSSQYVDFSTRGPFGHRIAKRSRFSWLVFTASGQLKSVESYGPGGFETWEQSWRVYRAGCIMVDQVSVSTFDAYLGLMFHYSRRYGQAAWAIQYQADARARLEQLERLRRKGAAEADLATNHPSSPSRT